MANYDDFKKIEFKVAKIMEAKEHPDADKLYVLVVDNGSAMKQVVAGIKNHYKAEDLIGKLVVLVDNLDPAMIRGVESQGMILATTDGTGMSIVTPDRKIEPGSVVK